MYINSYDFELQNANGDIIPVSLRLGVGSQLYLKKKYKENTTSTLFGAIDDVERFIDVMDASLKFKGNTNTIKSAEELIDLMAANDMLGMLAKQTLITAVGRASGLFSEDEKKKIDDRAAKAVGGAFASGDEDEKNA